MSDRVRAQDPEIDALLAEVHQAETKPAKQAAAVRAAGFDPDSDEGQKVMAIAKSKDTIDPFELAREAAQVDLSPPPPNPEASPEGMLRRIRELNAEGEYAAAARLERRRTRMIEGPVDSDGFTGRERARQEASEKQRQRRAGEMWRADPDHSPAQESTPRTDEGIRLKMEQARAAGHYAAAAQFERMLEHGRTEQPPKPAPSASHNPEPQLSRSQDVSNARGKEAEARAAGDYATAARWQRHRQRLEDEGKAGAR